MKSTIVYGGILFLSLGGAWMRWTKDPNRLAEGEVAVLRGDADKIEKITWTSPKIDRELTLKSGDNGNYFHLTETKRTQPPKPKPKEGEDPSTIELPPEETKITECKAADRVDKLLNNLSPLGASRELNEITPERKLEVELTEPKITMEIQRKGKSSTLSFSKKVGSSYYIELDGNVFLISASKVSALSSTRSLCNSSMWGLDRRTELPFVTKARLTTQDGQSISMTQQDVQENVEPQRQPSPDKSTAHWVNDETTEKDPELNAWMNKAIKSITIQAYVQPNEVEEKDLVKKFSLQLEKEGKKSHLETMHVFSDQKNENWYGKSTYTEGLVKLRNSNDSIKNLIKEMPFANEAEESTEGTSTEETNEKSPTKETKEGGSTGP